MNKVIIWISVLLSAGCTACPPDPHVLTGASGTLFGGHAVYGKEAIINIDKPVRVYGTHIMTAPNITHMRPIKTHCVYLPPEKCAPLSVSECMRQHTYIYMNDKQITQLIYN